jgi:phosphoribosyl 1,2-cyclic phosphate phosphodiesterase
MTLKVTILGCGSSGGVPRIDGNFGDCDPNELKNYRLRCSILVEKILQNGEKTIVLIDTSPDLRQQLLQTKTTRLDALLYTHDHADQAHGIDDVRGLVYRNQKLIETYFNQATRDTLIGRFGYIFKGTEVKNYPPLLLPKTIENYGEEFKIKGAGGEISFTPFRLIHGEIECVGFRFGNIAYCNDVNIIPPESFEYLQDLDLFIVDCLRYTPHPSHAHLHQTLEWVNQINPKHTILTNLHIDIDYNKIKNDLPQNIEPAYDFMEIMV